MRSKRGTNTAVILTIAVIITAVVVGVGTCCYATGSADPKVNILEIYHWWTSGSEKAAMNALVGAYLSKYPDVTVLESPVAGGGGITMREVMHSLILGGEAPDSFQSYPFGLVPYWEADMLEPIDEVWTSEVKDAVPDVVEGMCKMPDGHYYAVPCGVQQAGVIFYNVDIFSKYGLTEPTSWNDFWDICDTLKAEEVDAIALGDKNAWPLTYIFRTITASQGIKYYEDFINGKVTSADNPKLVGSLAKLNKILDYVNTDHAALTWDEAMGRVVTGEVAMSIMGDCGAGEFIVAEKDYRKDFGAFYAPGAEDIFGVSLDVFSLPKGAKHPTNARNWFKVIATKEAQSAFAGPKGFIPARTDATMGVGFSEYQRDESAVHFQTATYYRPGMWSGAPPAFMGKLTDIISEKIGVKRDITGAASAIANLQAETEWPRKWDLTP
ncbi:MAG: ABC transporter substrate-binding protein [Candidatus Aerophobetes bacterium]|nr:ABC transporter substrate-binding protein [Candidatus Aerophobetes bacterium]